MVQHYGEDYADGNSLCYGPLDREDMPDGQMYDEIIADWTIEKLAEDYQKTLLHGGRLCASPRPLHRPPANSSTSTTSTTFELPTSLTTKWLTSLSWEKRLPMVD